MSSSGFRHGDANSRATVTISASLSYEGQSRTILARRAKAGKKGDEGMPQLQTLALFKGENVSELRRKLTKNRIVLMRERATTRQSAIRQHRQETIANQPWP
jgi:hypothetical protein